MDNRIKEDLKKSDSGLLDINNNKTVTLPKEQISNIDEDVPRISDLSKPTTIYDIASGSSSVKDMGSQFLKFIDDFYKYLDSLTLLQELVLFQIVDLITLLLTIYGIITAFFAN